MPERVIKEAMGRGNGKSENRKISSSAELYGGRRLSGDDSKEGKISIRRKSLLQETWVAIETFFSCSNSIIPAHETWPEGQSSLKL